MATPIGHSLAGFAVYTARGADGDKVDVRRFGLCVCLAMLPDADFLPGLLIGQPALYHQGVTHSLCIAVLTGLVAALVVSRGTPHLLTDWTTFTLAYASHLLMDLFGPDGRPPIGLPLFWPFSAESYLSPLQLLLGVRHAGATDAGTGMWLAGVLQLRNVAAIGVEVAVVAPCLLAARWYRARRRLAAPTGDHA